jgi:streptogramin lyase
VTKRSSGSQGKRMKIGFGAIIMALAATIPVAMISQARAATSPVLPPALMGVVTGPDGKTLVGVNVAAQESHQLFITSVFTDEKGEYVFPHLSAGDYKVWAQAKTYSTDRGNITLDGMHTGARDFSLGKLDNFEARMDGSDWFESLPEDTANQKRMKQILFVACTGCHGVDVILDNKFDEPGWKAIVHAMTSATYTGWTGIADKTPQQMGWEGQIIAHHEDELAKYLAQMRGPAPSPMVLKPRPGPTGEAGRAVITQYNMPGPEQENVMSWWSGGDWEYGPTTGMHGTVGVHDVLAAPDGTAWIYQSRTTFETNRTLASLNPDTGEMTNYRLNTPNGRIMFFEQVGPGMGHYAKYMWMHTGQDIVRQDLESKTFMRFPKPAVMGNMPNSSDGDDKGRVWTNGSFGAVFFDPYAPMDPNVQYPGWHLFQQLTPGDGTTYGVTSDAEDNGWWSESYTDHVGYHNIKTGETKEFLIRDPGFEARKALATQEDLTFYDSIGAETWARNSAEPLPFSQMPRRLSADKYGDTVWVPNWAASSLTEINIHTFKMTYHELPYKQHPYKTTVDAHHNVYTDTQVGDGVYKWSMANKTWTYFQLPTHGCSSRHMSYDTVKEEIWVPCDQANTVDRIQTRSIEDIRSLRAAAVR